MTNSDTDSKFLEYLERIANAQARTGTVGEDVTTRVKSGDGVDVYQVPADRDLRGWKGPGTVVHVEKGKIYIQWQGLVKAYPADQVRFHVIPTFFQRGLDSNLVDEVENEPAFHQHPVVLGKRDNDKQGLVMSSGSRRFPSCHEVGFRCRS